MNTLDAQDPNLDPACTTVCMQKSEAMNTKAGGTKKRKGKPFAIIHGTYGTARIYKVKHLKGHIFQVSSPATENGPGGRRSFALETEARRFAQNIADLPRKCTSALMEIPVARLESISHAIAKLEQVLLPLNISIASGIEEYAAIKAKTGNRDLRDLYDRILNTPWLQKSKTPFPVVLDIFLKARSEKAGVRFEYHKTLYYTLGLVAAAVGNTPIGEITTAQLEPFVFNPKRAKRSNKTYRTNIRTFFRWSQLNEYLDYGSPTAADKLEKIRVDAVRPLIATVPEAQVMLTQIEHPFCLLFLAISLFSGVRHDELQRLTWDSVKDDVIIVNPNEEKRRKRRTIPIQPNLEAWLSPFRGRQGFIIPQGCIQLKTRRYAEEFLILWKRNWLRHAYASHRLSQTGSVVQTAQEDGHSVYVLERDYLHMVSKEEAIAFFALTPEACGRADWDKQVSEFLSDKLPITERPKRKSRPRKLIVPSPAQLPTSANIVPITNSENVSTEKVA